MKNILVFYVVMPLILGLIITYVSVYLLHSLDSKDWHRYGFPVGWKNMEATGEGYGTPTFTFYNPAGFVLDVLFWYGIALVIIVVVARASHKDEMLFRKRK